VQNTAIQARCFWWHINVTKYNKPFSNEEFVRQCMIDVAEAVCPGYKNNEFQKNVCVSCEIN
jgi:hypothetical protein